MSDDVFPRVFPIFPLAEVLLIPGAFLPLHIFEPRYRALVADCLAGEKMLAMALPLAGHGADPEPPVHPVCGLGRIVRHQAYPDGRSDIVLAGLTRMRIERELSSGRPYRQVVATPVVDEFPADGADLAPDAEALLGRLPPGSDVRAGLEGLPVGRLLDVLVLRLPLPVAEKHRIHAVADVRKRLEEAEGAVNRLLGRHHRGGLKPDDPRLN